jgi:hypothetical protein
MISAIWLPIGFIQLFGLLFNSAFGRGTAFALAAAMILLNVSAYQSAWVAGEELMAARTDAALFLEVEAYIDKKTDADRRSLLYPLFPVPGYMYALRTPAEILGEDGFRKIERHATFEEHSTVAGCFEVAPPATDARQTTNSSDVLVRGWSILPDRTLPEIILFSAGEERSFIGGARVGRVKRPVLAAVINDPAPVRCSWQTIISREFLPSENAEIKAWVYDAAHSKFLRLTNCSAAK